MNGKSILIVDDEAPIREMIVVALEMAGYDCLEAENTQQAHALIIDRKPDRILLDWMLPGTSGIELARRLKRDELTADTPIIMLTAKSEEDNKIQGLEVGADDYITKPFDLNELIARLHALIRRNQGRSQSLLRVGALQLDPIRREARLGESSIEFSQREFDLLQHLMERPGAVLSREQLEERLYGWQEEVASNAIEVHLHHLRRKLGSDWIKNVRGVGYKIVDATPARSA